MKTPILTFKSLHGRLMAYFLLALMVPLLATALYGHLFARDVLTAQAIERSSNQVHLQAESMVSSLRQTQGDALYLTTLRSLRMLRQQSSDAQIETWRSEVSQDFMVLLSVRPMYRALRLLDENGWEIVSVQSDGRSVRSAPTLTNQSRASYFVNTLAQDDGGVYVSSFSLEDEDTDQPSPLIHYAMRTQGANGVIVIDLHAGWLLRNLPPSSEQDVWAILDQDGHHLVYPQNYNPDHEEADLSPMLGGGRGSFETDHSVYVYDTIFPTASTPDIYWVLFRETPRSVLYANLGSFYAAAGGFLLAGGALAALLAFTTSLRLVQPINMLQQMVADFGRDGVAPDMPEKFPRDETGSLLRAFFEMAHELERKRAQEHRLIERLIRAQEEERKLIAYDLHDGLIQQLVGARFYLTNCREKCPIGENEARQGIRRGCDALTEAIVEGRRIIEGLRPAVLDDLGLTEALHEFAQSAASAAGWELSMELAHLTEEPDKTVSVTLFRIMQEALNNARKHARATHVSIVMYNGAGITLSIEDDGQGFDPAGLRQSGHGLGITTMQERAMLLGGACEIHSTPGQGTSIHVWVPTDGVQRGNFITPGAIPVRPPVENTSSESAGEA